MLKLHPVKLGLTAGILCGLYVFLGTNWLLLTGSGGNTWELLSNFYLGFRFSFLGSLIGLVWGFADGFIGGWVFAWLYNKLLDKGNVPVKQAEAVVKQEA